MHKPPKDKLIALTIYALLALMIGVIGFIGLTNRTKNQATTQAQTLTVAPEPTAIELLSCGESTPAFCLLSSGYDREGNPLISLKTGSAAVPEIYLQVVGQALPFSCHRVEIAPQTVYCLGPYAAPLAPGAVLEVRTVAGDRLLASGKLNAELAAIVPADTTELLSFPTVSIGTSEPLSFPTVSIGTSEPFTFPTAGPTTSASVPTQTSYTNSAYPNTSYPAYP